MKRIVAAILLCTVLLSGCSVIYGGYESSPAASAVQLTEDDSVVSFDIYPEVNGYKVPKPFDRPEYNLLNDRQKSIYIALDNAIYLMTTGYVGLGECDEQDIDIVYNALRNDRPEYFWLPSTYYIRSVGKTYELCFANTESEWTYTKSLRTEKENGIKAELEVLLSTVTDDMSQFDTELYLHDWLLDRVTYDYTALETSSADRYAWNIDGAFLKGKAVCEGYAKAMQVLLIATGFECGLVYGETDEAHVWNTVKVDGHWYHLDPTHNDSGDVLNHFFFNVTTDYMRHSRTIYDTFENATDEDIEIGKFNLFLPHSSFETQNYHVVNSLYISSMDQVESTVVSHICDAVRNGRSSVEFSVSKKIGFVFGETDAAEFFNLGRCISAANAELTQKQQIRTYSYSGVEGALGFAVSW